LLPSFTPLLKAHVYDHVVFVINLCFFFSSYRSGLAAVSKHISLAEYVLYLVPDKLSSLLLRLHQTRLSDVSFRRLCASKPGVARQTVYAMARNLACQ